MQFVYGFKVMIASVYSRILDQNLILVPTACNFTHIDSGSSSLYHIHKVYHLFVVFAGSFSIRTDTGTFGIFPGEVAIIDPNQTHIFVTGQNEEARLLAFKFYLVPSRLAQQQDTQDRLFGLDLELLERHGLTLPLRRIVDIETENVHAKFDPAKWSEIVALTDEIRPFGREYELDVTMYPVYPELTRHHNEFTYFFLRLCELLRPGEAEDDHVARRRADALLRELVDAVEAQAAGKFSLDKLSQRMGYSPSYLSGYFSRKVGLTLHEYHEKLRIQKACELLRDTDLPVTDIAHELEYSSSQHLSHRFAEITGLAPSKYRRHVQTGAYRFVQLDDANSSNSWPSERNGPPPGFPNCRVMS